MNPLASGPLTARAFLLATLVSSGVSCTAKQKGNDGASPAPASDVTSDKAMSELFPVAAERKRVDKALLDIWNALTPHGCAACHGAQGAAGWGKHQMAYWLSWKSQAVGLLGVLDPGVAKVNPRDMKFFAILSGDLGDQMPPVQGPVRPADTVFLEALDANDPQAIQAALPSLGKTQEDLRNALGTQLVYANRQGVCFDRRNTGADPFAESLCQPFTDLANFATTWKGNAAASIRAWNALANRALGLNHYDANEGIIEEEQPVALSNTKVIASVKKIGPETVYKLPGSNTVSFYVQASPDNQLLAFTETSQQANLAPRVFLLSDPGSAEGAASFAAQGMRYDPIFSPDFDFNAKKGFVVGASGAAGNDDTKNLFFYRPSSETRVQDGKEVKVRTLGLMPFGNPVELLAGYQTLAKITDATKVNPLWKPFAGKYIIMGKRWRWFAVDTVKNAAGETTAIKRLAPEGKGTNEPICKALTGPIGQGIREFDTADSMISPDGRFLSIRIGSGLTRSLALVNTLNCTVEHVPSLGGKPVSSGKAAFSQDGNFIAFHAFGEEGTQNDPMAFHNLNLVRKHANEGRVSNIFIYSLASKTVHKVTNFSPNGDSVVALFPMFNRDSTRLYYSRHRKGDAASEIVVREIQPSAFP